MSIWIPASLLLVALLTSFLIGPFFEPALNGALESIERDSFRALLDSKERALRALKDLELDHSMGKVSAEDFEHSKLALSLEVVKVLDDIKRHGGE